MSRFENAVRLVPLLTLLCGAPEGNLQAQTGACATVIPGNALPDLIVDTNRLKADLLLTTENFAKNTCAVIEGCVSSKGNHDLLRFSSSTPNVGAGDLYIGDPSRCPNLFHASECHNHFHFKDYSAYRLWTEAGYQRWLALRESSAPVSSPQNSWLISSATSGKDLLMGRKQGFCMIDVEPYLTTAPTQKKYTTCGGLGSPGNQGLQVGWTDVYGQHLDCQYIEIDHLREGRYVLEVQVNPDHLLPEANYGNNYGAILFQYSPKRGGQPAQVIVIN
jgi:lysyl oxidase